MIRAASSDGVSVAVHELAGRAGEPIVLFGHATGFHGFAYLPIAKRLVEAHGGELLIESQPGLGTSATVSLPPARVRLRRED